MVPLKLSKKEGVPYVFCDFRKKYLVLTPEEWVRQHAMHFLVNQRGISKGRVGAEIGLKYNGKIKRADIVVYNQSGKPQILVECKAPEVKISKETMFQAAQYNFELGVNEIILTNGIDHFTCLKKETGEFEVETGLI